MLIAWMVMGYHFLHPSDPARYMSILEPSYRGLLLRKEFKSMAEFLDECWEFYQPLGATRKDDPVVFTFKSGAKIYTSHLGDKNAFEQFRGWGLSRIGIEELTQIEDESVYRKLLGSLRGKKQVRVHNTPYGRKQFPAIPSQIMATTNPDGPGASWVKKRFVKVLDQQETLASEESPDGRHVQQEYADIHPDVARGESISSRQRRVRKHVAVAGRGHASTVDAWRLGCGCGKVLHRVPPEWAPSPTGAWKYPWARHVVPPIELKPWWFRFRRRRLGHRSSGRILQVL